jgi:uncharacterized protein YigE (DUF2233 family)
MLNQCMLIGKVSSKRDEVVDNGTLATILEVNVNNDNILVYGRDQMGEAMSSVRVGEVVAIKGRLDPAPDGLTVIVERLARLGGINHEV